MPNWWQMACQFQCFSCKAAICTDEKEFKITCEDCGEEQFVVKPCCSDPSTNKRFSVKLNEQYISCPDCNSDMVRLPCCGQFQPDMRIEHNIFDCVDCSKYSVACTCSNINCLSSKSMSWRCKKKLIVHSTRFIAIAAELHIKILKVHISVHVALSLNMIWNLVLARFDYYCFIFIIIYVLCYSNF